jgi:hypothetical protein
MKLPLAIGNLFLMLLIVPIGVAISGCLYFIGSGEIYSFNELIELPIKAIQLFFWMPLVLLPAAMVFWATEIFMINKFFTNAAWSASSADFAPGTFSVRRRNTAARCDICHQDDLFIAKTGFCRRCQRYTF